MSVIDPKMLAAEIVKSLQEADQQHLWINREEHALQHEFLGKLLKKQAQRDERNDRIKERIMGSVILAGGLWFVGFIGHAAIAYFRTLLNMPTPPSM